MNLAEILRKLSEPFPVEEVGFKVQEVIDEGRRGLVITYIDARSVASRLDEVVGTWEDVYRELSHRGRGNVAVECSLSLYVGDFKLTRVDAGIGYDGDYKAAYSDAFKRAAVKFGVGRYLYALPKEVVKLENGEIPPQEIDRLKSLYNQWIQPLSSPVAELDAINYIWGLITQLKDKGKGEEALELLFKIGWTPFSSLDKSRQAYKALREMLLQE